MSSWSSGRSIFRGGFICAAPFRSLGRYTRASVCALTFLPDEAYYSSDAVLRTLLRLTITRRNLLQWHTSTDAGQSSRTKLTDIVRGMWVAPAVGAAAGMCLAQFRPDVLTVSLPLLSLWFISPLIAWWLSRPLARRTAHLNRDDIDFLEELSRRTWRFYEAFIGPEDNWLPPDNYQDYPAPVLAHRTSPTNMGLALLSNLAANDFGFISTAQLEERTAKPFRPWNAWSGSAVISSIGTTRARMEPLPPRYVSTVDSGNLVGHLLTLHIGLLQLADQNILPPKVLPGLGITLRVLIAAMADSGTAHVLPPDGKSLVGSPQPLQYLEQCATGAIAHARPLAAGC